MKTNKFFGMNNLSADLKKPRLILNMDNKEDGTLEKRQGTKLYYEANQAASLFSDTENLFFTAYIGQDHVLVSLDKNKQASIITAVPEDNKLYYVITNDKLYINSAKFKGIYHLKMKTFSLWERPEEINQYNPSMTEDLIDVPYLTSVILFGARIIGINNKDIIYSLPFSYNMFSSTGFIRFEDIPRTIIPDTEGIYICFNTYTEYLHGIDIETAKKTFAGGYGGVDGTLAYTDLPTLSLKAPIWLSDKGIVAGVGGKLLNLTIDKLNMPVTETAAAFMRKQNNEQYTVSMPSSKVTMMDSFEFTVFKKGG